MPRTPNRVAAPANAGESSRATAPLCVVDELAPVACALCALVVFAALFPAELCKDEDTIEELEGGDTETPTEAGVRELLASAEFW